MRMILAVMGMVNAKRNKGRAACGNASVLLFISCDFKKQLGVKTLHIVIC